MAIVEFARHVLGYEDANSIELAPETTHPVIALMPEQVMQLVDERVRQVRRLTDAQPGTEWVLQYSPETFSLAELEQN